MGVDDERSPIPEYGSAEIDKTPESVTGAHLSVGECMVLIVLLLCVTFIVTLLIVR